jgi:cytochrome c biogenesis factor|tara:strand:+ start:795 stop:1202 length:408 start_codon:yes stop_codon:yes gene_type:complete
MKFFNTQLTTDKFAGTVSLVCALQCLLMPSFFIATSGLISLSIDNEFVHSMILLIAVPVSLFALFLGLKNHQNKLIFLIGLLGLIVLIAAFFFAKVLFGENEEILFTVLGSMMVIYAHYKNHETCKEIQCKSCHD